jgi:UDP-glucose/GDP-mannose dehydrogenase family, NAD binding domain
MLPSPEINRSSHKTASETLRRPSNAFSSRDFSRKCSFLCDNVGRRQAVGASVTRTPTDPGGTLTGYDKPALTPGSSSLRDPDLLVIGLGYVGLPLAAEAARRGLTVVGYDPDHTVVSGLNAGRSHVGDVSGDDVHAMLSARFLATDTEDAVGWPAAIVICVPSPLTADNGPDLGAVRSAAATAARRLRPGVLVVLESTTYPGTTEEVVRPLLEKEIEAAVRLCPGTCVRVGHRPELPELAEVTFGSVAAFIQALDYRPGWPTCRAPETGAAMLLRSVSSINAKYILPARQSISWVSLCRTRV